MEEDELASAYEIASILGAVIKKVGPTALSEEDFDFGDLEQEVMLVPNDDGTITVALGYREEE
jgi:hypothetical protein